MTWSRCHGWRHKRSRLTGCVSLALAAPKLVGGGLCRARFASGGLVWRREGVACSDACSDQACAFLASAVGALLVRSQAFAYQLPDFEARRPRCARGPCARVTALVRHRPYRSPRRPATWAARRLMARLEKGWHWQRRCAQQIGMRLSCCGSCRTSGPSARHADTFPLWPGRPCASSARSALRSARVTCPRPSSPRRAQPK